MRRISEQAWAARRTFWLQKGHHYRTDPYPDTTPYYDEEFFRLLKEHRRKQDEEHWARMAARMKKPPASPAPVDTAANEMPPAAVESNQSSSAEPRKGFLGWPWFGRKPQASTVGDHSEPSNQSAVDDPTHPGSPHMAQPPSDSNSSAANTISPLVSRSPDHPITRSPDPASSPAAKVPEKASPPDLDAMAKFMGKFLVCSDHQTTVLMLWVVHTYCFDYLPGTPYLNICSAEKQSGKTVCLQLLRLLSRKAWMPGGVRAAHLIGRIAHSQPTLLLDDWHTAFRSSDGQSIIGFLNAGSTPESCYALYPSQQDRDRSIFCPKAFAGAGELPSSLADRCIPVVLQRARPAELTWPYWQDLAAREARLLIESLPAWAKENRKLLRTATLEQQILFPAALSLRQRELAAPLLGIAAVLGGKWPRKAKDALLVIFDAWDDASPAIGRQLLTDIRGYFIQQKDPPKIFTSELLKYLNKLEDAPWSKWKGKPLGPERLRNILRHYPVPSARSQRIGDKSLRGFAFEDFMESWQRYTPELSTKPSPQAVAKKAQPATNGPQPATIGPQPATNRPQPAT